MKQSPAPDQFVNSGKAETPKPGGRREGGVGFLSRIRLRLSYANVISSIALFLALSTGGAYAANEWTGANIKNGTLTSADVKNQSLKGVDVKNGSLRSIDIANGAVTGAKIGAAAVGATQLADGAVTGAKIGAGAVTGAKIGTAAVGATQLADGAVSGAKIAAGAVDSTHVADGSLTGADVADTNSLTTLDVGPLDGDADIIDNTITSFDIATDSVDSDEVLDFGLTNQDVGVLFAQVNADGTVANSSGTVTAIRISVGIYEVDFGRNIAASAFIATQGEATPGSAAGAIMGVTDRAGNVEAVFVTARDFTGALADRAFQLVVVN